LYVVVGPLCEAAHTIGLRGTAAEDDHRQLRVLAAGRALRGADLTQDLQAEGIREAKVEQQQLGLLVVAEAQSIGGRRRRKGPEAIGLEVIAQQFQSRRVVLADDDRVGGPRSEPGGRGGMPPTTPASRSAPGLAGPGSSG
jgi:hypothetical protein